jgi:hypothetical protein
MIMPPAIVETDKLGDAYVDRATSGGRTLNGTLLIMSVGDLWRAPCGIVLFAHHGARAGPRDRSWVERRLVAPTVVGDG